MLVTATVTHCQYTVHTFQDHKMNLHKALQKNKRMLSAFEYVVLNTIPDTPNKETNKHVVKQIDEDYKNLTCRRVLVDRTCAL